jgi:SAM-dependent methyltransferase
VQDDEQASLNEEVWLRGDFVGNYATRKLRPVEEVLLDRYRDALRGSLLELGSGSGRLTGHLAQLGGDVHGLDLSPAMVAYGRREYPRARFSEGNLRDLSRFDERSLDVVFAPYNVLDVLGDAERRRVFGDVRRILRSRGMFIMSSHNRGYPARAGRWRRIILGNPRRPLSSLRALPRRLRNHRRLRTHEHEEASYAIVNDEAHEFSVLHYYISRDQQDRQLSEEGFELIECLDLDGRGVAAGAMASQCPELHYVARPVQ